MEYTEIRLYAGSGFYEDEDIKIFILKNQICLIECTFEHSSGERFGLRHVLNEKDAQKFLDYLGAGEESSFEVLKEKLSGKDAVKKFKKYCEDHSIQYVSYIL